MCGVIKNWNKLTHSLQCKRIFLTKRTFFELPLAYLTYSDTEMFFLLLFILRPTSSHHQVPSSWGPMSSDHPEVYKILPSWSALVPIILRPTNSHHPKTHKLPSRWSLQAPTIPRSTSSQYPKTQYLPLPQGPETPFILKSTSSHHPQAHKFLLSWAEQRVCKLVNLWWWFQLLTTLVNFI